MAPAIRALVNLHSIDPASPVTRPVPSERPTDLLLLNASNYPRVPLYPYAFVQVSEVARRHGLRVASVDLLGVPEQALRPKLADLVALHRPRAIGLHLRQLDSLFIEDYRGYLPREGGPPAARPEASFRPVEATQRIASTLRELSDAPLLLGGHGFTSSPRAVFERVRPDLGVVGEPDALFARFDDALAGRDRASIPNLMFRGADGVVTTPRVEQGPAAGMEYTPAIIDEIKRFYGSPQLAAQTFSVELMRGCPYRCYFCCEPAVKGRSARVRPLEAVLADVELLAAHDLRRIWMVCSEMNVFGPDLAVELGERLIALQERTGVELRWHAFSLPSRMGVDVWRTLARSGFRGGFNTFMSLDDDNLAAGKIPHRAIDAIEEYKNIEIVSRELAPGDEIRARGTMALFLGNAYATTETIARSLRALHEHGLLGTVRFPGSMAATRIFETLPTDAARADNELVTFGAGGAEAPDLSLPSFEYPAALTRHFGGKEALERFLRWIDRTLLSRQYEETVDGAHFLAVAGGPALVARTAPGAPAQARVAAILAAQPADRAEAGRAAHALIEEILAAHAPRAAAGLAALGAPPSLDEALALPVYELLRRLYARFETVEAALAAARAGAPDDGAVEALAARYLLHRRNVILDPRYRAPLFGGGERRGLPML